MIALLSGVALASLLGSAHCPGMCGGLTAIYAGRDPGRRQSPFRAHAGYSGGRLVAYTGLGALARLAGSLPDLAGSLAGIQRVPAVGAGILILAWGLKLKCRFWQRLGRR